MQIQKKYLSFAFPVTDITIARYLSAKEVDYIGIPLEEHARTSALIHQLKEWLEGPLLIGLYPAIDQLEYYNNSLDGFYFLDDYRISASNSFFDPSIDQSKLLNNQFYLDRNPDPIKPPIQSFKFIELNDKLDEFLEFRGFAFNPGHEYQTGLFDFGAMEDWFDKLDKINGVVN